MTDLKPAQHQELDGQLLNLYKALAAENPDPTIGEVAKQIAERCAKSPDRSPGEYLAAARWLDIWEKHGRHLAANHFFRGDGDETGKSLHQVFVKMACYLTRQSRNQKVESRKSKVEGQRSMVDG